MINHTTDRYANWLPILIVVGAIVIGLIAFLQVDMPFRTGITMSYLLLAPGFAYTQFINTEHFMTKLTLSVVLSMTINTIVSESLVIIHLWSMELALIIVLGICILGAGIQMIPKSRGENNDDNN